MVEWLYSLNSNHKSFTVLSSNPTLDQVNFTASLQKISGSTYGVCLGSSFAGKVPRSIGMTLNPSDKKDGAECCISYYVTDAIPKYVSNIHIIVDQVSHKSIITYNS